MTANKERAAILFNLHDVASEPVGEPLIDRGAQCGGVEKAAAIEVLRPHISSSTTKSAT